jgi:hypothetical protein
MQAIIGGIAAQETMKVESTFEERMYTNLFSTGCNRKIYADTTIFLF